MGSQIKTNALLHDHRHCQETVSNEKRSSPARAGEQEAQGSPWTLTDDRALAVPGAAAGCSARCASA